MIGGYGVNSFNTGAGMNEREKRAANNRAQKRSYEKRKAAGYSRLQVYVTQAERRRLEAELSKMRGEQ